MPGLSSWKESSRAESLDSSAPSCDRPRPRPRPRGRRPELSDRVSPSSATFFRPRPRPRPRRPRAASAAGSISEVSRSSISNSTKSSSSPESCRSDSTEVFRDFFADGDESCSGVAFAAGAANALKMSSSSLKPLPSSEPEVDGDTATDSATNFPASGLLDGLGLDFLSTGSTAAAEVATFAEGMIFDGVFSSKLKPKKSPGMSSLLALCSLDSAAADFSLLATGCEEFGAGAAGLDLGAELDLPCGAALAVRLEAFSESSPADIPTGSSAAAAFAALPPPSPKTPARKSQLPPLFFSAFSGAADFSVACDGSAAFASCASADTSDSLVTLEATGAVSFLAAGSVLFA